MPRLGPWLFVAGILLSGCSTYTEEMLGRPDDGGSRQDAPPSVSDAGQPTDANSSSDRGTSPDVSDDAAAPSDSGPDAGPSIDVAFDLNTDAPIDRVVSDVATPDVRTDTNDGPPDAPPTADVTPDRISTDGADAPPSTPDASSDAGTPPPDADAGGGDDALDASDAFDSGTTCRATPTTHDEDGDGVVDECDNCPSIANADQADVLEVNAGGTADGVGDACDPRPALGGDSIYLFDGLNFTTIPAEWMVNGGTWTASGTTLAPTATTNGQEIIRNFPTNLGNYLAETTFTFDDLIAPGSASLPFRMDSSRNGWGCAIGINNIGDGQLLLTQVTAGVGETSPSIFAITAPTVGDRVRLLGGAYGTNIYCMRGSTTGSRINRTATSSTGDSGFRASAASARFEYLLVYRLGGTVP